MAYVPWLTGDVILASRLNQMTRVAGAWNGSAGHDLYIPASAFSPFSPWTSRPHFTYVLTGSPPPGGEWVTLPMTAAGWMGGWCVVAVPTRCTGLMKFKVWYLDMSGVPGSDYYLGLRFGAIGLGEQPGINQVAYDLRVPAYISTQGIFGQPQDWTPAFDVQVVPGDLLWIFAFHAGPNDASTNDFPFVGLSLRFRVNAVNDA